MAKPKEPEKTEAIMKTTWRFDGIWLQIDPLTPKNWEELRRFVEAIKPTDQEKRTNAN